MGFHQSPFPLKENTACEKGNVELQIAVIT